MRSFLGFNREIALRAALSLAKRRTADSLRSANGPIHLFLCIVDHFEPSHGGADRRTAMGRMEDWMRRYPRISRSHKDYDGRSPRHSFFYPWDEFEEEEMARLSELCAEGRGEIELHLHHRDDTEETLRKKLRDAVRTYREYGALSEWPGGMPAFSFIHGDWALNNSRCDGGRNYCGVNDEIRILIEEGCYADFTFPAWQHTAQPRQVNRIFYAQSSPSCAKGHDRGTTARAGNPEPPGLPIIQGPLVPYLRGRGKRVRLAMEDGDLAHYRRYTPDRLNHWVRAGIHVAGRPDRLFIKLHTHGAPDKNREVLLGSDLDALFTDAEARYNDGLRYRLHYVTAREMYNLMVATVDGVDGNPVELRDYRLPRPAFMPGRMPVRK